MKPDEINQAVAMVMGWKQVNKDWAGRWVKGNRNPVETDSSFPRYDSDLNAAAEFAKYLAGQGWNCSCNNGLDTEWECDFSRPASARTHPDNISKRDGETGLEVHYAAAATLARAICESGLRALNLWKEDSHE